ncbi:MAG: YceI family protein [Cyclobacteriaceae bacterium]|nr:YceI family protein [Cyclobacteriaceae bacterium]
MKKLLIFSFLMLISSVSFTQSVYMTRSGQISFFSKTALENIDAVNNEVTSLLNPETGEIVFAVLIKSFHFERALMEEHFNENYMESDKIPKSTFQGKITNLSNIDFKKEGTYPASVEGDLTIHGVKQHISTSGNLKIEKGKIHTICSFIVKLSDYKIEIPSIVSDKIAETLEIKVNCNYEPKS